MNSIGTGRTIVSGCSPHAYDQSGGRVQCLLSRGFGETQQRRRPNDTLCRPCGWRPAKLRSRALCHPRWTSDFRGASPALSCLSRNPLELALYTTPKIAALPLCGSWATTHLPPESRATVSNSQLTPRADALIDGPADAFAAICTRCRMGHAFFLTEWS